MVWIELLGPGGVGKSYFFKELCKIYPEFLPYGFDSNDRRPLMRWLPDRSKLKMRLQRRENIRQFSKYRAQFDENDESTIKVFFESLPIFTQDSIAMLELCQYYSYKYRELKFFQEMLGERMVYLSEDGIIHLMISGINSDNINWIAKPDILIYLTASDEYIVENRKKRMKVNQSNMIERRMSEDELFNVFLPRNLKIYREKAMLLEKFYGDNFHKINVENLPAGEIVSKIFNIASRIV